LAIVPLMSAVAGDFIAWNDLALRAGVVFPLDLAASALTLSATGRFFFDTCNQTLADCNVFEGSMGAGGTLEAVLDVGAYDEDWIARPYASILLELISGGEQITSEQRLCLQFGINFAPAAVGRFKLYFSGLIGFDVGYHWETSASQAGLGIAWGL
jgi:hypothetical protein